MPGYKRWHLEVNENGILLIRDSKEASHKNGQPLGPIKELFYGCEHGQAKTFKAHAIEVRIAIHARLMHATVTIWHIVSASEHSVQTLTDAQGLV